MRRGGCKHGGSGVHQGRTWCFISTAILSSPYIRSNHAFICIVLRGVSTTPSCTSLHRFLIISSSSLPSIIVTIVTSTSLITLSFSSAHSLLATNRSIIRSRGFPLSLIIPKKTRSAARRCAMQCIQQMKKLSKQLNRR